MWPFWFIAREICSRKICSVQGRLSPGAGSVLSAAKSCVGRWQLRRVTVGLIVLQDTEQALVLLGCFLISLASHLDGAGNELHVLFSE